MKSDCLVVVLGACCAFWMGFGIVWWNFGLLQASLCATGAIMLLIALVVAITPRE